MQILGIDGCKYGWIVAQINEAMEIIFSKHPSFEHIINQYPNADRLLVDMPIGLSDKNHPRTVEQLARKKLKPWRTSSVFTPPCREAVYASDYDIAKEINIATLGKSISIQAWYIVPKIKEIDLFLEKNRAWRGKIWEAHPEVCFSGWNGGIPMKDRKSNYFGELSRLFILSQHMQNLTEIYNQAIDFFPKKEVKRDDLLDAACLAITGYFGEKKGYQILQDELNKKDAKGIEMKMVYFQS